MNIVTKEKIKRYLVFFVGLFVNSLGVSLITKADLGTSPISSIPYVLSLYFPFSLGQFTIFFSIFLILLQLFILRRNFKIAHLLQIPVSIAFGYFIDICMAFLTFIHPQSYGVQVIYLLIGCVILGIGVYMEVLADVIMLPGESFVRAIVFQWKTEFGITKVIFDVSMSVIAGGLSFLLGGQLNGVREGTVVAALLVGFIARIIGRYLSFLPEKLFGAKKPTKADTNKPVKEAESICITIGRQYGSGGHNLGKQLAQQLSFDFYDKEIIQLAAGSTGYTPEYIAKKEEKMTNSLLYDLVNEVYGYADQYTPPKDTIFETESKIIREAAKKNSVIVGRCADWILHENPKCIRIFLYAPLQYRIKTVMQREGLDEKEAKHQIQQIDRLRRDNYHYYTKRIWGMASNYHVCIDTSLGEKYVYETILHLVEKAKQLF